MSIASIRRAGPDDADRLTAICRRAKAHRGYHAAQLARWADELLVTAESIRDRPTFVAQAMGAPQGFHQLVPGDREWVLEHLWVLPEAMGQGVGAALFAHAARLAADHGAHALTIDADPFAQGFYESRGAVLVGRVPAPIDGQPDRTRPQLRLALAAASTGAMASSRHSLPGDHR